MCLRLVCPALYLALLLVADESAYAFELLRAKSTRFLAINVWASVSNSTLCRTKSLTRQIMPREIFFSSKLLVASWTAFRGGRASCVDFGAVAGVTLVCRGILIGLVFSALLALHGLVRSTSFESS
jgi:hypothetical protein